VAIQVFKSTSPHKPGTSSNPPAHEVFKTGFPAGRDARRRCALPAQQEIFAPHRPQGRPEFAQKPRSRKANRARPQGRKGAVVSGLQIMNATKFNGSNPEDQYCKRYRIVFQPNTHDIHLSPNCV